MPHAEMNESTYPANIKVFFKAQTVCVSGKFLLVKMVNMAEDIHLHLIFLKHSHIVHHHALRKLCVRSGCAGPIATYRQIENEEKIVLKRKRFSIGIHLKSQMIIDVHFNVVNIPNCREHMKPAVIS